MKNKRRRDDNEFLDFFAGPAVCVANQPNMAAAKQCKGLFRLGLEQAGMKCKGHCEIDKYANLSYEAMHQTEEGEWFEKDITQISAEGIPDVALWAGGFPCQDASVAGGRKGLLGERTGLFFEFIRLLRERGDNKPRWLIQAAPKIRRSAVSRLCVSKVLNRRMLRASFLLMEEGILPLFYVSWPHLGTVLSMRFSTQKISGRRKTGNGCTLSAILQVVPDEYFYRAAAVCSDAQLYKQAGNAVTVPVVRAIGEKIMKYLNTEGTKT